MNVLENLKYTKDHEWIRMEGEEAYIGITDFAQHELGDIVYVDIPSEEGTILGQEEVFGSIEAVKTVSDLFMPVGGEVIKINGKIDSDPSLINSDPYGDGWIIKIKVTDILETDSLLTPDQYKQLIGL
jgi:glycine cleavage system H protein